MAAVQKQTSHAPKGAAMIKFNRLSAAIVVCTLAAATSVSAAELNGTLKKFRKQAQSLSAIEKAPYLSPILMPMVSLRATHSSFARLLPTPRRKSSASTNWT